MIPRLWTRVEGVTIEPSIMREKSWVERVRDFLANSVAVKTEAMLAEDLSESENVDKEK